MKEVLHQIFTELVRVGRGLFNFLSHGSVRLLCGCWLQIRSSVRLTLHQGQLLHLVLKA